MKKKLVGSVVAMLLLCLTADLVIGCSGKTGADSEPADSESASIPSTTYLTTLDILCEENLFFSRYDVVVFVDDEQIGVIEHGSTGHFEIALKEGQHYFTVQKEGEKEVDGSKTFEVNQETAVTCSLSLTSDQIEVKDFEVLPLTAQDEENLAGKGQTVEDGIEHAEAEEYGSISADEELSASTEVKPVEARQEAEEVITADTDEAFAAFLETEDYNLIGSFVDENKGSIISFEGNVAACQHHGDSNTRFDYLIYPGDYSETSASGPAFQLEDVSYSDLHLVDGSPDSFDPGLNIHIAAKVLEYNPMSGLVELKPVEIAVR